MTGLRYVITYLHRLRDESSSVAYFNNFFEDVAKLRNPPTARLRELHKETEFVTDPVTKLPDEASNPNATEPMRAYGRLGRTDRGRCHDNSDEALSGLWH